MTPEDLDLAAAVRALLRHPLVRAEFRAIVAEASPAPTREGYLSTAQVADRLGIGTDTVLSWIAKGRLRASKLPGGRDWRVKSADLEAALSGGEADQDPLLSNRGPIDLQARARSLADSARRKGPRR